MVVDILFKCMCSGLSSFLECSSEVLGPHATLVQDCVAKREVEGLPPPWWGDSFLGKAEWVSESRSVVSCYLCPHGLQKVHEILQPEYSGG